MYIVRIYLSAVAAEVFSISYPQNQNIGEKNKKHTKHLQHKIIIIKNIRVEKKIKCATYK